MVSLINQLTTVVLLNDGQGRNSIKFKPNLNTIKNLKLILASSTALTINLEYNGYPEKQLDIEANKPVIINIGKVFGIPTIQINTDFFDI